MFLKHKVRFIILFLMLMQWSLWSQTSENTNIIANSDSDFYQVGDIITVNIDITKNSGFQNIYFDLKYNGSIMVFDSIEQGNLVYRVTKEDEFLYAVSDAATSSTLGNHVIISYGLLDNGSRTFETGTLATLKFRVIDAGEPDTVYTFSYQTNEVRDSEYQVVADTVWQDSQAFKIGTLNNNGYIQIKNPYENQVFYEKSLLLDAIFSADSSYIVVIKNSDTDYTSKNLSAASGSIEDHSVSLKNGFNTITAYLYDSTGNEVAKDSVTVLKEGNGKYIKIKSPKDHELVNSNLTSVIVSSPYQYVKVNNSSENIESLNELDPENNNNHLYRTNVWLHAGFNKITATVRENNDPDFPIYSDEIAVYYQVNDSVFRFVKPLENEVIRNNGTDIKLNIKGEISSQFDENHMENTVHLKVIYTPDNQYLNSLILVNNQLASISESDIIDGTSQAAYMFKNDFEIDISDLDAGQLELIAYKNKKGVHWEDEIHRIVRMDNNKLWIDLKRPNIISSDIINTYDKLRQFDLSTDLNFNHFQFNENGYIHLKATDKKMRKLDQQNEFMQNEVADMIETKNGDLYALINRMNQMFLYKKTISSPVWEKVNQLNLQLYGYDLCETDMGILIGASNLFANNNSGLYLFDMITQDIVNITINEPIPHVQFIEERNGTVYLYGNDYSHIYTFNIFSLENDPASPERLKAGIVDKVEFDNDVFIKQFVLSDDAQLAAILTENGVVSFYKRSDGTSFNQVNFNFQDYNDFTKNNISRIIKGEYQAGKYNAYLLLEKGNNTAAVIMDDKYTHKLYINSIDHLDFNVGQVVGADFHNNQFHFINYDNTNDQYVVRNGQILFNHYYSDGSLPQNYQSGSVNLMNTNMNVLFTKQNTYIMGFGDNQWNENPEIVEFYQDYVDQSSVDFDYRNDQIEGLKGFSFEVDTLWTETDYIELGYALIKNGTADEMNPHFQIERMSLMDILDDDYENKEFKVNKYFDAQISKYIIEIEFNEVQSGYFIQFDLKLRKVGNVSPSIGNLTVYKKVPVRLPKSSDRVIYLPIHGFVYDTTVSFVTIGGKNIDLERNGAFYYDFPIERDQNLTSITIKCTNKKGDEAEVTFSVELFDSKNDIWEVSMSPASPVQTGLLNQFDTDKNYVEMSGYYYGLIGAKAGYEVYKMVSDNSADAVLFEKGVFGNTNNNYEVKQVFPDQWPRPQNDIINDLGTGFEFGYFQDQRISLTPGKQIIKIYVENPGGKRVEYLIDGENPVIDYDLDQDQQNIIIDNSERVSLIETDGDYHMNSSIIYDNMIELTVQEDQPNIFSRNYLIYGHVESLYNIYDLKVKSNQDAVTFDGSSRETIIDVDPLGRFSVNIHIEMPADRTAENYEVAFIPTSPFLNWLNTGLIIKAKKSFVDTAIIPDFSPMLEWTDVEKEALSKPVHIKFNRQIPENTKINLLVNYQKTITGVLNKFNVENNIYQVLNESIVQNLTGVKYGKNRVQWWLYYSDGDISSSVSGKPGMEDFVFDLTNDQSQESTIITFPLEIQTYYNDSDTLLPELSISKSKYTDLSIILNSEVIYEDSDHQDEIIIIKNSSGNQFMEWSDYFIREGKNQLMIQFEENNGYHNTLSYDFLYDSLPPEISLDSYKLDSTYKNLIEFEVIIKEANLAKVSLIFGLSGDHTNEGSLVITDHCTIQYIGNDLYKVKWSNLDQLTGAPFIPSITNPVTAQVFDHTGEDVYMDPAFMGLTDNVQPVVENGNTISINEYIDTPHFENEENNNGTSHTKFFNSSIALDNLNIQNEENNAEYLAERAHTIVINGNGQITNDGNLTLKSGKFIVFQGGFRVEKGGKLLSQIVPSQTAQSYLPKQTEFSHSQSSDNVSFLFKFRYEEDAVYDDFYVESDRYRRIFTLYNDTEYNVFLAYTIEDNYLYLIKETEDLQSNKYYQVLLDGSSHNITYLKDNLEDWNIINLGIQRLDNTIYLSVNNNEPVSVQLDSSFTATLFNTVLNTGAKYYFGEKGVTLDDPYDYTSHFSIAYPFYKDEIVIDANAAFTEMNFDDPNASGDSMDRAYYFVDQADDIDADKYYKLRVIGDHFTNKENADYTEDNNVGALKVTSYHKNVLKVEDDIVLFDDADNPVLVNCSINQNNINPDTMMIVPDNSSYPAKYFFGNKFGNHGLINDKWFSVSGRVLSIGEVETGMKNPELVLRINGKEQSIPLTAGDFHLVYEHEMNEKVESVQMYILTQTSVEISNDMILSHGNYVLPPEGVSDITVSKATTRYLFSPKGTIDFWFKPFNVNPSGFVNYPAVLLDNAYIKIGTAINIGNSAGKQYAKYYAKIGNVPLQSDVLVTEGWHHIQFSYNRDAGVAYLYIDGKLAKSHETGGLPSADPDNTGLDNISFGATLDDLFYAEGYLDEINLSNLYKGPLYANHTTDEKRVPILIDYTESSDPSDHSDPQLTISKNGSDKVFSDIEYTLISKEKNLKWISESTVLSDHGFDLKNLSSGSYLFRAKMIINGHRYSETVNFVKNDRPEFIIKDYTPLVIEGIKSNLEFDISYDGSYLTNSNQTVYAAMALRIEYNIKDNDQNLIQQSKTIYLTQDFINADPYNRKWYYNTEANNGVLEDAEWKELEVTSDNIGLVFKDIISYSDVNWELKTYYITDIFDENKHMFDQIKSGFTGTIYNAYYTAEIKSRQYNYSIKNELSQDENEKEYEYKIEVQVSNSITLGDQFKDLAIGYQVADFDNPAEILKSGAISLNGNAALDILYDDILPEYGKYICKLYLVYQDKSFNENSLTLNWVKPEKVKNSYNEEKVLEITDFSLIYLDKPSNNDETDDPALAKLYLKYQVNYISDLYCDLVVYNMDKKSYTNPVKNINLSTSNNYYIFNDIPVQDGKSRIIVKLYSVQDGLSLERETYVNNSEVAPEVIFTNTVPSLIAYNNVMFSWRGQHDGVFKPEIQYSYNFDNQGWTAYSENDMKLELFDLAERDIPYRLLIKSMFNDVESVPAAASFTIDISKPQFDKDKIEVDEIRDDKDILYAVNITGSEGAVVDQNLTLIEINGQVVPKGKNGSFELKEIPVNIDGDNKYTITAYDKIGNYSDYEFVIHNPITQIIYPVSTENVVYSPVILTGVMNEQINVDCQIYLFDPLSEDRGENNFEGWLKAKINEDRTFFVEDVYINPGTPLKDAHTPLKMAVVLNGDKIFTKDINVWANELIRPIEMVLSTHAVEGENADTTVTIDCQANVNNISSWSVDFDGDDIYDAVKMVDNPVLGQKQIWTHTYSSLGKVKPRVRVITNNGHFFSVADEIIIHEEIEEASNLIVGDPISMSTITMDDHSQRIFVLAGTYNNYRVDVYEVGRNMTYVSDRLYQISLAGFGLDQAEQIKVLDKDHFYVVSNRNGSGKVVCFQANEFENYLPLENRDITTQDEIYQIDGDKNNIYLTLKNLNNIVVVPLDNYIPLNESKQIVDISLTNGHLGLNLGITKEQGTILIADYFNQKLVRLSESMRPLELIGAFGNGEGEFIKPKVISAFSDRIAIYDEGRGDIQIVDKNFQAITNIVYDSNRENNYLTEYFLNDIAGLELLSREESDNRIYYYILALSKSTEKLAMLKLPRWEELRAKVRGNKLVFLKDKEVYMAKPSGSDLAKVLSSDSIPRIEGTIDYPAMAPDGKQLVFTSRIELYNGQDSGTNGQTNVQAYDNLYVINIDGTGLQRIPLGAVNYYEIERPEFSSNGDKIIFSAKPTGGNWQLYEYFFATGGIKQVISTNENMRFPYYSPDDRFVVFTTNYSGNEEIEILDLNNTNVRVRVTHNNSRDSYPVWHQNYTDEFTSDTMEYVTSKIAYIGERGGQKALYYIYIEQPAETDVRIVTDTGASPGLYPDNAAIKISNEDTEGDYPCFTGDGTEIIYEHFNGWDQTLQKYELLNETNEKVQILDGAKKPAGMKNTIADFSAAPVNGDELLLTWRSYLDSETRYTVLFKKVENNEDEGQISADEDYIPKEVFTKDSAQLKGLEMGAEYYVKVQIMENNKVQALSRELKVKIPEVYAKASYEIDEEDPYVVHLHGWKADPDFNWKYFWIIDNQEIATAQTSQDFTYEFATQGKKKIQLKVTNSGITKTHISEPLYIEIITDIKPVIEYNLVTNSSTYIELSAEKSLGSNIDLANAAWTISGVGSMPVGPLSGSKVIVPLDGFKEKINVNLKLKRRAITGQPESDILEKNLVIDLDLQEVKPVILYEIDQANPQLVHFFGDSSFGNIDWYRASWTIFNNGVQIFNQNSASTFSYLFPENNIEAHYTVSLTVPRKNDGQTRTTTKVVEIQPSPIKPLIDYEVLSLMVGDNVIGAKVLLSCAGSQGNGIDYMRTVWSLPIANSYNEQTIQTGPTAVFNLVSAALPSSIEVGLTLYHVNSQDPITVYETVKIKAGEAPETDININPVINNTSTGYMLSMDILNSTGVNINWEQTQWTISNGTVTKQAEGPVANFDVPITGEEGSISYTCTVYQDGMAVPVVERGEIPLDAYGLRPVIEPIKIGTETNNVYKLSVTNTKGYNIDWERTTWYIYDGNEGVVQKYGATISHAFKLRSDNHNYPVMVEMFYKGSTLPIVNYTNIDVEGDELLPVIHWDMGQEHKDANVITLDAGSSLGSNINWSECKWTFGDSSESQYGPTVVHKYAIDSQHMEYNVSMTLSRKSVDGTSEVKTVYKTIHIAADTVKAVVKAKVNGNNFLVLSADESEGRGLLMDRSVWLFDGAGDNQSFSKHTQGGVITRKTQNNKNNTYVNLNNDVYFQAQGGTEMSFSSELVTPGMVSRTSMSNGGPNGSFIKGGYSLNTAQGNQFNILSDDYYEDVDYDGYKDENDSFSNSNMHTGAICRRTVGSTDKFITVTLFVYRAESDGSVKGESITVYVDLDEARKGNGVVYGK